MLEFLFKMSPPSVFGLPGDDYTVRANNEIAQSGRKSVSLDVASFECGHLARTDTNYRPCYGRACSFFAYQTVNEDKILPS